MAAEPAGPFVRRVRRKPAQALARSTDAIVGQCKAARHVRQRCLDARDDRRACRAPTAPARAWRASSPRRAAAPRLPAISSRIGSACSPATKTSGNSSPLALCMRQQLDARAPPVEAAEGLRVHRLQRQPRRASACSIGRIRYLARHSTAMSPSGVPAGVRGGDALGQQLGFFALVARLASAPAARRAGRRWPAAPAASRRRRARSPSPCSRRLRAVHGQRQHLGGVAVVQPAGCWCGRAPRCRRWRS